MCNVVCCGSKARSRGAGPQIGVGPVPGSGASPRVRVSDPQRQNIQTIDWHTDMYFHIFGDVRLRTKVGVNRSARWIWQGPRIRPKQIELRPTGPMDPTAGGRQVDGRQINLTSNVYNTNLGTMGARPSGPSRRPAGRRPVAAAAGRQITLTSNHFVHHCDAILSTSDTAICGQIMFVYFEFSYLEFIPNSKRSPIQCFKSDLKVPSIPRTF